ncbi:MAG: hypothetical protein JWM27_3456 [Gemmatimonadetes bacterium]|nr:hypothetical protein [Gemmatimonadota bacterium]
MKTIATAAAALVATAAFAGSAAAQTATQDVGFEVQAISQIAFSGSPTLTISTATAGSAPTSATASGSYAVTTNETNQKITAEIDATMPTGVTLTASLAAPSGGTSAGVKTLSTTAQDVVTGISTLNQSGLSVSYGLSATSAAGVVAADSRTVTYTILAGS